MSALDNLKVIYRSIGVFTRDKEGTIWRINSSPSPGMLSNTRPVYTAPFNPNRQTKDEFIFKVVVDCSMFIMNKWMATYQLARVHMCWCRVSVCSAICSDLAIH